MSVGVEVERFGDWVVEWSRGRVVG